MKKCLMILALAMPVLLMASPPAVQQKNATPPKYVSALVVTAEDFQSLTASYRNAHGDQTQGGVISRQALINILNSMPYGADFINFRFTTDEDQISLMMMGGKSWYEGTRKIPCYRNGGSAASYCPTVCELNVSADGTTLSFPYQEYVDRTQAYAQKYPDATFGGNIDRTALKALLESLPAEQKNIAFRFCADPNFKHTSVIFIGGAVGQPDNQTLMVRNGVDANSFCPIVCEVRD